MARILDCLEALHINLPPTLGASQVRCSYQSVKVYQRLLPIRGASFYYGFKVKSMRKELKAHLLRILKHPASLMLHPRITTLLTDLGASQSVSSQYLILFSFYLYLYISTLQFLRVYVD